MVFLYQKTKGRDENVVHNNESERERIEIKAECQYDGAGGKADRENPINALIGISNGEIPKLNDLLIMLWGALQPLNKGYTINKVWDLYDEFVSEGKSINDLIEIIMEVMKVSGFIKEEFVDETDDDEDSEEKNC